MKRPKNLLEWLKTHYPKINEEYQDYRKQERCKKCGERLSLAERCQLPDLCWNCSGKGGHKVNEGRIS